MGTCPLKNIYPNLLPLHHGHTSEKNSAAKPWAESTSLQGGWLGGKMHKLIRIHEAVLIAQLANKADLLVREVVQFNARHTVWFSECHKGHS